MLPPEMRGEPPYKNGDRVFIVRTGHYQCDETDWLFEAAAYGIVENGPFWRDAADSSAVGSNWEGPDGWAYYLDLYDNLGQPLPDNPYWFHELELIPCCTRAPSD